MTKPSIFAEIRTARVERILDAKQSRVLTSPWMRRTLSLVAIISSYAVLATLLIPTPYKISKTNRIRPDYDLIDSNWLYDFRDRCYSLEHTSFEHYISRRLDPYSRNNHSRCTDINLVCASGNGPRLY